MLEGKVAVVTGGSRGIGAAVALKLAEQGADVAILYAGNEAAADDMIRRLSEHAKKAKAYRCDVSDFESTKQTVADILSEFGGIDILVNNAGIVVDKLVLQMGEQDFDKVVDTSLKGAFNMIKHTYGQFAKRRSGRIINIASVAGMMGNAGQANYAAAKAGVIGLTKSVARELSARNITCNAIAPGLIETDMTNALNDKTKEAMLSAVPLKRMGLPEEVASLAAFLAGESAGYITGEVIKIDGGLYI